MSNILVKYKDIAVDAKEEFEPYVSEQNEFSNILLLKKDDVEYKNFSNPCEFYSFMLDGYESALPEKFEDENIGFWSDQISDKNGGFKTPITLTLEANQYFSSSGLSFVFDDVDNVFPSSLNIKWYRGSELLNEADFNPSNSIYFCQKKVEFYNKIIVTFYGVCLPYRRLKIRSIEYGMNVQFDGSELRGAKIIQELDPLSTQISINTFDFTLESKKGIEYSFQTKQPLSVFFDDKLLGTHFIKKNKENIQEHMDNTKRGLYWFA